MYKTPKETTAIIKNQYDRITEEKIMSLVGFYEMVLRFHIMK